MKTYKIYWDAGWGRVEAEAEAESQEKAIEMAYESCKEEAEYNWCYGVVDEEEV